MAKTEPRMVLELIQILETSARQIVHDHDLVPARQQALAQMASDKASPPGDECPHCTLK